MGITASPSVTGKAPPGMKSFWTSMTRRASVGWMVMDIEVRSDILVQRF